MKLIMLRISISVICAAFAGVHLFLPNIEIDAVTLAFVAIGLLPWFQPLIKSLELPGGVKVELQDVKAATDKISSAVERRGDAPLIQDISEGTDRLSFIRNVADQDPNLALVGLRIELEKLLVEIAEASGIETTRRSAGTLLDELCRKEIIPEAIASGLSEFIVLGNQAAHGAAVSKDAAALALARAPQLLGILASLSPRLRQPVTVQGEIPKAEVLAGFNEKTPIEVRFHKPFARPPDVRIGFFGAVNADLSSGQLKVTLTDNESFKIQVLAMPDMHSVATWSVKWKAIGQLA